MRLPDPLALKFAQPKDAVIFAASQLQGERELQEDFFLNFNDECFVVTGGTGKSHGDVASKLGAETAVWAYKLVRQRPYYWQDKKLFMERIFRSTNITLWQKRRERGFSDGLATAMEVLTIGARTFWLGHVGDSSSFLLHDGTLVKLTKDDDKAIGVARYGLLPQYITEKFDIGDTILMATRGVTHVVKPDEMQSALSRVGTTAQSATDGVLEIFNFAKKHGATNNMTAIIAKRVSTSL